MLLLCMLCFAIQIVQAQNVFWSEDFGNGNPTNWANYDPNYSVVKWEWSDDRFVGLVSGQPLFNSHSYQNGFYLFNSYVYGQITHDVRLETTAINCSNQPTVVVHFENQFAWYSSQSVAILGVSTDSMTWSYDTLFTNIPANTTNSPLDIVEIDISNIAANEPNVYLQFRWIGKDEFAWRLDDIRLQDGFTPPAQHDLAIDLYSVPLNYAMPLSQVQAIEFGAIVTNNGLQTAQNLQLKAQIIDDSSQAVVYEDSVSLNHLNAGATNLMEMANTYTPSSKGKYYLKYELTQNAFDDYPLDNIINIPFVVSGVLFSKDPNTGFIPAKPSTAGDYEIGNIYEIKNAGYTADEVIFSCSIENSSLTLNGRTVDFKLYEVDSNVDLFFQNYHTINNPLVLVGVGSYTFTIDDDNDELFATTIEDIAGGGTKVNLKANTRYILMAAFAGAANIISIQASDAIRYDANLATMIKEGTTWNFDGFGPELTAVVRMTITPPVNTQQQHLEVGKVKVFPNPTTDKFQLDLEYQQPSNDVQIEVYNHLGQLIKSENRQNILKEQISYSTKNWSKGVYFVQIQSDFGKITRRIVVY